MSLLFPVSSERSVLGLSSVFLLFTSPLKVISSRLPSPYQKLLSLSDLKQISFSCPERPGMELWKRESIFAITIKSSKVFSEIMGTFSSQEGFWAVWLLDQCLLPSLRTKFSGPTQGYFYETGLFCVLDDRCPFCSCYYNLCTTYSFIKINWLRWKSGKFVKLCIFDKRYLIKRTEERYGIIYKDDPMGP